MDFETIKGIPRRIGERSEPDRQLDADIMELLFDWAVQDEVHLSVSCLGDEERIYWHAPDWLRKRPVPRLTASVDACVLVLGHLMPSAMWSVCSMEEGPFAQVLRPMPDGGYVGGLLVHGAPSPARALAGAIVLSAVEYTKDRFLSCSS